MGRNWKAPLDPRRMVAGRGRSTAGESPRAEGMGARGLPGPVPAKAVARVLPGRNLAKAVARAQGLVVTSPSQVSCRIQRSPAQEPPGMERDGGRPGPNGRRAGASLCSPIPRDWGSGPARRGRPARGARADGKAAGGWPGTQGRDGTMRPPDAQGGRNAVRSGGSAGRTALPGRVPRPAGPGARWRSRTDGPPVPDAAQAFGVT